MIYIFLPVYNEEENIFELLSSIEKFWNEQMKYESITIGVRKKKDCDTPRKIPRAMKIHNWLLFIFLK